MAFSSSCYGLFDSVTNSYNLHKQPLSCYIFNLSYLIVAEKSRIIFNELNNLACMPCFLLAIAVSTYFGLRFWLLALPLNNWRLLFALNLKSKKFYNIYFKSFTSSFAFRILNFINSLQFKKQQTFYSTTHLLLLFLFCVQTNIYFIQNRIFFVLVSMSWLTASFGASYAELSPTFIEVAAVRHTWLAIVHDGVDDDLVHKKLFPIFILSLLSADDLFHYQ